MILPMRATRSAVLTCALLAVALSLRAELKFEATEMSLKPKIGEKELRAEFKFTNTGIEPVSIKSVHSSCGCTVPDKPTDPIAPNASGIIPVSYKPADRQGRQTQTIQVETSDGKNHELRLVVDLPVRVTFTPRLVLFRGAEAEAKLATVTFGESDGTTLLEVTEQSPAFEVVGEPKLEQGVLKLSVRHIGAADADARASVRIRTRDSAGEEHTDILYLRHSPAPAP
jgi:hypothetical protein